ncbi:MAG TPA: TIGR03790 family protein [Verrucomicrobiae bacterium]|jgi:uncharacterized protein (TIGR03790 family)|nr:TIGR03790 family protein [Verrucomicrobiae bacterium]
MKRLLILLSLLTWLMPGMRIYAAGQGDQVVVIYNTRVPESRDVAEHYAAMRHVPGWQVFGMDLPERETISRAEFQDMLQKPLEKKLEARNFMRFGSITIPATNGQPRKVVRAVISASIRYLVLCYGVPLTIVKDPSLKEDDGQVPPAFRRNEAAVDSELACLPVLDHMLLAGPRQNFFYGCTNAALFNPTNGILLVARLDGPTAAIARALVDKAMEAETNGLWGRAYFDTRGLPVGSAYRLGDDWINLAAEVAHAAGYDTIVDSNYSTFPPGFPMSQTALYAGWYEENPTGPFARQTVEFMPGAFAYHLQSFSAATLRTTKRQWVGPLLALGATATMGCVDEPYLGGTPNIGIFFARFIYSAFSFGEAAYACQNYVSWQTTVVGDPLYRPFGTSPLDLQKDLERRHDPLVEWSYLRTINVDILRGKPVAELVAALEQLDLLKTSAVLQEKLAELYTDQGKPSSSVFALQKALELNPTPEQRVRLMLNLAKQLQPLGRDQDAYEVYQQFLQKIPDYPDQLAIYKSLVELAHKLNHGEAAAKYQHQIDVLTFVPPPAAKGAPQRHGI